MLVDKWLECRLLAKLAEKTSCIYKEPDASGLWKLIV